MALLSPGQRQLAGSRFELQPNPDCPELQSFAGPAIRAIYAAPLRATQTLIFTVFAAESWAIAHMKYMS